LMANNSSAATPRVTTGMMIRFVIFLSLPHHCGSAMQIFSVKTVLQLV
jgi:hypothetical protein